MAIKFQYNKTYLQQLNRELKIRLNALPTLKAKESALRFEVKKAKDALKVLQNEIENKKKNVEKEFRLWNEFPNELFKDIKINIVQKKIAGIRTPDLGGVDFEIEEFSLFNNQSWIPDGIEIIKEMVSLTIKLKIYEERLKILEFARRKTTQKVNLYEKVQIPEYQEAIIKIKRFLEDEENLSKASQKILKAKLVVNTGAVK